MTKRTLADLRAEDLYDYSREDSTPHEASTDDTYDPMDVDSYEYTSSPDSYNAWLDVPSAHWEDIYGPMYEGSYDPATVVSNVADSLGSFTSAYDSFGGDDDVANSVVYNEMLNDEDLQQKYETTAAEIQKYHYCRWYHLLDDTPPGIVQCGVCGRNFTAANMPLPPDF